MFVDGRLRPDVQVLRRFPCWCSLLYFIRPGTLYDILLKLHVLNATEIQDKIYAPLEIATDRD